MTTSATSHAATPINLTAEANSANHTPTLEEKSYQQALTSLDNLAQELEEKRVYENCVANPPIDLQLSRPNLASRFDEYKKQHPGAAVPARQVCKFAYQEAFEISPHYKNYEHHSEQYFVEREARELKAGAAKNNVPVENLAEQDRQTILKNADTTKQQVMLSKLMNLYTKNNP
jgi:hypothetical protein